jgi:hypothetical protein
MSVSPRSLAADLPERPGRAVPLSNNLRSRRTEALLDHAPPRALEATYVLPIRRDTPMPDRDIRELTEYLESLATYLEVIVVDSSPAPVFKTHHDEWQDAVRHISPEIRTLNGKVGNVITGARAATHNRLVIADDDVRYSLPELARIVRELDQADIVRPQNYFDPRPWHARWDTARSLLNRLTGGDWPGTLAVRQSVLLATGGYDGEVLFENLELVRTIKAAGGRELVPLDLFVRRLPPDSRHFWSQRIRQAYDELARPVRLLVWLSVLPALSAVARRRAWRAMALILAGIVGLAELGRQRAGGSRVFPRSAAFFAPAWVLERSICSWIAVGMRLIHGGVPYRGRVLGRAATPVDVLRRRYSTVRRNGWSGQTADGGSADGC